MKKTLLAIGLLLFFVGPVVGIKVLQIGSLIAYGKDMQAAGYPATAVATALASEQTWENTLSAVGSLRPVQGVTLSAELGGKVVEIAVENGAAVKAGDLLVKLETSTEEAQLASAEASERLAQVNLDRSRGLLDKNTIAQSEFDAADATYKQAVAQTANIRAQLNKKTIRAPFTGRVGIRLINLGQTLGVGDPIIPLQSLDPIFVDFTLPQQRLSAISVGQAVRLTIDGVVSSVEGKVTAINPEVDSATRSVRLQATLANPDERLRPGMFAQVALVLPEQSKVLVVPTTALVRAPFGDSVFVVEKKDDKLIARQQFVRLGETRGDFTVVTQGIKAGDRVVSAGAFKLINGASVAPNDEMQPKPSLEPKPGNS